MNFKIPDYKIDDTVWILDTQDCVLYGTIVRFTLAVSKETTNIYYDVQLPDESFYVVKESDIIPHNELLKKPKFEPGDTVAYKILLANKTEEIIYGRIDNVQITLYDRYTSEIVYTMEDDKDYWVLEEDIISHVDTREVIEHEG